uniref:Uncharacterized protein n=1 Tax=Rhizophora mucronata TaxID=61149 RepID=A0A2P2R287_RHIMU
MINKKVRKNGTKETIKRFPFEFVKLSA